MNTSYASRYDLLNITLACLKLSRNRISLFSAKLQVIEYSATIPKFPELTGNFGESGRRLGVER